jgi:dynactin 5
VFVSQGVVLHPPSRVSSSASATGASVGGREGEGATTGSQGGGVMYYPLRILDQVYIGPHSVVRAAEIRSNVYIGSHCSIGNMVIIKENVKILDGTVLPANTVWSSGMVVGGRPGRVVGEVGEGWGDGAGGGKGEEAGFGVGVRSRERWASVGNKKGGG